ncbi:class A beta-lactamase [Phenylobacterium sp.]|uniref:class A beta-lactamase n=1 Tax=Phenylobacterium sp. TaxID=1871053 RepID=UPI0035659394
MTGLQSLGRVSASLGRRDLLVGAAGLALSACGRNQPLTASHTPRLDMKRLDAEVAAIAARALPGILGFGLMNLESGEFWVRLGDRTFPMQSVFKMIVGAAALSEIDAGRLAPGEVITLTDKELSPPWSPIADAWPARTDYTVDELLTLAVSISDSTAADLLMKRIGGPGAVTAWLQDKDVHEVRVDRYERELQPDVAGMASFRPAWKGAAAFEAAMATIPSAQRLAAMRAAMADPRDSSTPRGMLGFLRRLDQGELISPASTRKLLSIMLGSPRGAERIKAGLPKDVRFAHKIGTWGGAPGGLSEAYNDVGIFTLRDRRSYAVAAFLTGSTAPEAARAALFADLGRTAVRSVG